MTVTARVAARLALVIQPTGAFRLLDWNRYTPQTALRCDTTHPVVLTTRLVMWTDADTCALNSLLNAPVCELLCNYQALPAPHFGDAAFTGAMDHTGSASGLTGDQALVLLDRYLQRPPLCPPPYRH